MHGTAGAARDPGSRSGHKRQPRSSAVVEGRHQDGHGEHHPGAEIVDEASERAVRQACHVENGAEEGPHVTRW